MQSNYEIEIGGTSDNKVMLRVTDWGFFVVGSQHEKLNPGHLQRRVVFRETLTDALAVLPEIIKQREEQKTKFDYQKHLSEPSEPIDIDKIVKEAFASVNKETEAL